MANISGSGNIQGTSGADVITGSNGGDQIFGLGGDDLLAGLGGNDELHGGTGRDDHYGGDGIDTVYFDHSSSFWVVNLANKTAIADGLTEVVDSIENVVVGSGGSQVTGDGNVNFLTGGSGSDWLKGGGGNDHLLGAGGSDTAAFSFAYAAYSIVQSGDDILVSHVNEGQDRVYSDVESFQFSDVTRTRAQIIAAISDTAAPLLISFSPFDNSTGIAVNTNITISFNEAVKAGSGNILIYNSNGTVAKMISVTDTNQVSFSGSTVTINPSTDLAANSGYYINVASGVIRDLANNNYAGFTTTDFFNFTTAAAGDTTAPLLTGISPFDNSTGVAANTNITISFNESVKAGSGNILIYNSNGTVAKTISVTDTSQVSFSGSTVTINPATDLAANSSYYVNVASGVIKDNAGNNYAGFTDTDFFNFTTAAAGDTIAPQLTNRSPADDSTGVAVGTNITLSFSEAVKAGSGNILIHNSNGTVAKTISVTDTGQVTFSGSTVTIDPNTDLAANSGYYVNLATGVIDDLAGNDYAGISGNTAFNFTTAPDAIQPTGIASEFTRDTRNPYLEALIYDRRWDNSAPITYFFAGSDWDPWEIDAYEAALDQWSAIADLSFRRVFNEAQANFIEHLTTSGEAGLHWGPGIHDSSPRENGVHGFYNTTAIPWSEADASAGGFGRYTFVHELGHALGLGHTHEGPMGDFQGRTAGDRAFPSPGSYPDHTLFSVMSYRTAYTFGSNGKIELDFRPGQTIPGGKGYVAAPSAFDVAAIQSMYGSRNFNPTNDYSLGHQYWRTIWDTGGTDTITYSGSGIANIDLRAATLDNSETAGGGLNYIAGIYGGYTIAASVGIENAATGSGDDHLTGNQLSNRLSGGSGDDTYYFSRNSGNDTIFDISGSRDAIYYHGNALEGAFTSSGDLIGGLSGPIRVGSNLVMNFREGTTITVENYFSSGGTNRVERFVDGNEGSVLGIPVNGFDTTYYFVVGSDGDPDLSGEPGTPSYVAVSAGSTTSHTLNDGDLSTLGLVGATGALGTAGSENVGTGPSLATLASASESEDPFDDWLIGADGADTLIAHDGDDVLFGNAQNDQLSGGSGNDFLDGGEGADRLDGGPDTAGSNGLGDTALYAFAASGVSVSLGTGSGTRGDAAGDTLIAIENLVGSEFGDDLTGNAGTNLILGLGGDDTIDGGTGADGMDGGDGNDTLIGGAGDDVLIGSFGNDLLDGGPGVDTAVFSGPRAAYAITRNGNILRVSGPDGFDTLTKVERLAFADATVPSSLEEPNDFNDDGRSDLLLRENQGYVATWEMNGAAHVQNWFGLVPAAWHFEETGDFNGDGRGDFLLRENQGSVATWEMNGATHVQNWFGPVPTTWHFEGTGDFNGDGKIDFLLHNDNGSVATWEMNGATHVQNWFGQIPTTWHFEDTGDFNGDGKTDLLLRNDNGAVATWEMNGATHVQNWFGPVPTTWHFEKTGDFNGDGKTDLLLRNDNGSVATWEMNGATHVQNWFGPVPTTWHFEETGDFNGDGRTDLLLRNDNGSVATWEMNGATHVQNWFGQVPTAWHFEDTGDFNGDGKTDLLLREDNGYVATWEMDGATHVQNWFGQVPAAWHFV